MTKPRDQIARICIALIFGTGGGRARSEAHISTGKGRRLPEAPAVCMTCRNCILSAQVTEFR